MAELLFDKLTYMDRLKRAGIDDDQARAHGEALEGALRESVATKADVAGVRADLANARAELKAEIAVVKTDLARVKTDLENRIELAVRDMTIRMGVIAMALFAALASIKFFG
jgi:hypothetical protein